MKDEKDLDAFILTASEKFKNRLTGSDEEGSQCRVSKEELLEYISVDEGVDEPTISTLFDVIGDLDSDEVNSFFGYVLDEYGGHFEDCHIFSGYYSADSFGKSTALYVFKFGELHFCHYLSSEADEGANEVNSEPSGFIYEAASEEREYYELEKKNEKEIGEEFTHFSCEIYWNVSLE